MTIYMENRKKIFRPEVLRRLSSPDDLNEILSVVNPSSWAVLFAVMLILAGFFVWSLVGSVERKITASAEVSNGVAHFTVKNNVIKSGMHVIIGDTESVMRDTGKNQDGSYIGAANVPDMRDGIYEASITIEHTSPIKLLFN